MLSDQQSGSFISKQNALYVVFAMLLFASIVGNIFQRQTIFQILHANYSSLTNCGELSYELQSQRTKRDAFDSKTIEYAVDAPPFVSLDAGRYDESKASSNYDEQHHFFFPLYTQLTDLQITKICTKKYGNERLKHSDELLPMNARRKLKHHKLKLHKERHYSKPQKYNRYQVAHQHHRAQSVCLPIHTIEAPVLIDERIYHSGTALRKGARWLLTEFRTGNTLFQYNSETQLEKNTENSDNLSTEGQSVLPTNDSNEEEEEEQDESSKTILKFPSRIHTLYEPFYGTDHTVDEWAGELVFYYMIARTTRLQALHLNSARRTTRLLDSSTEPLYKRNHNAYGGDFSIVDLEADDGMLWALFRTPNDTALTVAKMALDSLKELTRYRLTQVLPHRISNAFISCGVLYTVDVDNESKKNENLSALNYHKWRRAYRIPNNETVSSKTSEKSVKNIVIVKAVFDFHTERYIKPPRELPAFEWYSRGEISSVQYDSLSNQLSVFDGGRIFTITLKRNLKLY